MAKKTADELDKELAALEAELAALDKAKPTPKAKAQAKAQPAPRAPTPSTLPSPAPSLWRRDGDAWVRSVPGEARVVRRVLDENGNVVREEPATRRDLDEVGEVKAERGVSRLMGRFRK